MVAFSSAGAQEWIAETPYTLQNSKIAVSQDGKTVLALGGSPPSLRGWSLTALHATDGSADWAVNSAAGTAIGLAVSANAAFVESQDQVSGHGNAFKTDAFDLAGDTGARLWTATQGNDEASSLAVSSGAVYVSGNGTTQGSQVQLRTIAYSSSGAVLWKQTRSGGSALFDGSNTHTAVNPMTGEVYVVAPASTTHSAFYTVAYSAGGAEQWAKTYTGANGAYPRVDWPSRPTAAQSW